METSTWQRIRNDSSKNEIIIFIEKLLSDGVNLDDINISAWFYSDRTIYISSKNKQSSIIRNSLRLKEYNDSNYIEAIKYWKGINNE
jgi:NADPH-dependent ferric siderophore reductase